MKRCPTCNTPVPEGAAWCRMCGETFTVIAWVFR